MKINLYLPDDKKELYEEVKLYLQKEGKSLSQLFLKCLEEYVKRENIVSLRKWKEELLTKIEDLIPEPKNKWEWLNLEKEFKIDGKVFDAVLKYIRPTESALGEILKYSENEIGGLPVEEFPMAVIDFLLVKKQSGRDRLEQIKHDFLANYQSILARNHIPYFIVFMADREGNIKKSLIFDIPSFQTYELSKKNINKLSEFLALPTLLKKQETLENLFPQRKYIESDKAFIDDEDNDTFDF